MAVGAELYIDLLDRSTDSKSVTTSTGDLGVRIISRMYTFLHIVMVWPL